MSMRKSRKMRRSRGMSKRRTARRSRSMRMRGGVGNSSDQSTTIASGSDQSTNASGQSGGAELQNEDRNSSSISGEGAPVGGPMVPELNPNMSGGRRRRHRRSMRMRGGDDSGLPVVGAQRQMYTMHKGGKRRSRRGGSLVATAALPFGLWGLQRYYSKNRGSAEGSVRRRRGRRS
jgi:hypothetical protein